MKKTSLAGKWEFRQANTREWMPANVPGGAHTDLMALGKIPDPFYGDNELKVQWVAKSDWEYRRSFKVTKEFISEDQVYLVCDGLDTIANVFVNDKLVGASQNMFRQYRWDIKGLLKEGDNEVRVYFYSPVNYASEQNTKKPMPSVSQAIAGGPHIRKAPCQFGWDWGPQLPPIGIWQHIRLEGYSQARIKGVHLRQFTQAKKSRIEASVNLEQWGGKNVELEMVVTSPDGKKHLATTVKSVREKLVIEIRNPQLWWPNGYGTQPLYQVSISLKNGNDVLDARQYQLGLRSLELVQKPDEWGQSFTFEVNGVSVFAKGSDWIPADSFPTRITDEHLENLFKSTVASHQNMLRVWGGGFYEEERFYNLCDKYGVLIWQDMVFACNVYPFDDPDFVANVKEEIYQNMERLRHRASLALWCGNNEMEWGWESWSWMKEAGQYKEAYDVFFHKTLPVWVAEMDPDRTYWPSSPSSNTPFTDVNGQKQGDAHYWEVWHGRKPFTAYRDQYPRFMSEFGFQSLPPMETVKTYAEEKDWNMTSYIMEFHQRSGSGNGLMIGQMTDTFLMPKDFSSLVYLSMILQAEGIRYGVEHWRRNKHRVSGTLIWQLNDCWPVASWASLDYFGRWKALHYAAKRFYAPVLLSVEDVGQTMSIHLTSDVNQAWKGEIVWQLSLSRWLQPELTRKHLI
jgi:beta-mannosidase